jgi:hypothetical protein
MHFIVAKVSIFCIQRMHFNLVRVCIFNVTYVCSFPHLINKKMKGSNNALCDAHVETRYVVGRQDVYTVVGMHYRALLPMPIAAKPFVTSAGRLAIPEHDIAGEFKCCNIYTEENSVTDG